MRKNGPVGSGKVTTLASSANLGGGEDFRNMSWSPDGRWQAVGAEEFSNGEGPLLRDRRREDDPPGPERRAGGRSAMVADSVGLTFASWRRA